MTGFCLQSGRADSLCSASNHAARCARTECPSDDDTRLCRLTREVVPRRACPCKTPCADRDLEETA